MKKVLLMSIGLIMMQSAFAGDNKETQRALPRPTMQDYFAIMHNVCDITAACSDVEEKEANGQPLTTLDKICFESSVLSNVLNLHATMRKFK